MATKYHHYEAWGVFEILTFYITSNNEDISLEFVPDTYGHALTSYKNNDLKR